MNVLKNMEAVFLVAAVLAGATTFASAEIPKVRAAHNAQIAIAGEKMAVVKVTAKRLSAAEKAASI